MTLFKLIAHGHMLYTHFLNNVYLLTWKRQAPFFKKNENSFIMYNANWLNSFDSALTSALYILSLIHI